MDDIKTIATQNLIEALDQATNRGGITKSMDASADNCTDTAGPSCAASFMSQAMAVPQATFYKYTGLDIDAWMDFREWRGDLW